MDAGIDSSRLLEQIVQSEANHCFVCGPRNTHGLRVHFSFDAGAAKAVFTPTDWHEGWQGVIHGGILAALLDEAMAYTLFFSGQRGVTARMELRYRAAVYPDSPITVSARIVRETNRIADMTGVVHRGEQIAVEGTGRFMKLGALTPDLASPLDPVRR